MSRRVRRCLRHFMANPDGVWFLGQSYSVVCMRMPDSMITMLLDSPRASLMIYVLLSMS